MSVGRRDGHRDIFPLQLGRLLAVIALVGRQHVLREQASHHVRPLHIVAVEVHQHLIADARTVERTATRRGHRCGNAHPRRRHVINFLLDFLGTLLDFCFEGFLLLFEIINSSAQLRPLFRMGFLRFIESLDHRVVSSQLRIAVLSVLLIMLRGSLLQAGYLVVEIGLLLILPFSLILLLIKQSCLYLNLGFIHRLDLLQRFDLLR